MSSCRLYPWVCMFSEISVDLFMVSCPIQLTLFALFHPNSQKRLDLKVWPWNYLCVICHLASYYSLVTNWNRKWWLGCIYWRKSNQWMPFAANRIAGAQHLVRSGQYHPWRGSKRRARTAQDLGMQTNPAGKDSERWGWSHAHGEVVYDAGCKWLTFSYTHVTSSYSFGEVWRELVTLVFN